MAKKKSKIASNRGYATVSAPSKKIEPVAPVPVEPEVEPIEQVLEHPFESLVVSDKIDNKQEVEDQDPVLKLVKKYESLNDHKAQAALDRMLKDDSQQQNVPDERIKKFRLTADVEKDLLQVIKHKDSDIFGKRNDNHIRGRCQQLIFQCIGAFNQPLKNSSNEYDKEKIISQFDILYRTLNKLGFEIEDISASFEATLSKSIDDHLDWVKKRH